MKPSSYITIMFLVALLFTSVYFIVIDFQTAYPSVEINTTWKDKYNYMDNLTGVDKIVDETTGEVTQKATGLYKVKEDLYNLAAERNLLLKIVLGGYIIILATVTAIQYMISAIPFINGFMADILISVGVPAWATVILGFMILLAVIFAILSAYRRYPM